MERFIGEFDAVLIGRTLLALVLCGLVGLERSAHERASGLRPHILVGLGACLMTLAGAYGFADLQTANRDPLRVASYVVSGIGFLGAGAILRHGTTVRGLTTAASLWGAAGIGIAVGAGMGGLAAVTVGLVLFTLTPLQRLEARFRLGPAATGLAVQVADGHRAERAEVIAAVRRRSRRPAVPPSGRGAIRQYGIEWDHPQDGGRACPGGRIVRRVASMAEGHVRQVQPHVLVVDDDEALRRLYADLLAEEGYRTTLRADPGDGLDEVVALTPDLVILDLVLGEAEAGWAFLERLKADPATVDIPVLVCTAAQPLVERMQERLTAWDCEVLAKPFDIDVLVARVTACLDGAAPRPIRPIGGGDHRDLADGEIARSALHDLGRPRSA